MSSLDQTPSSPFQGDHTPPSSRAFAQGTGVVLQTVGVILFLSTCCVCSLSGLWDPALSPAEVRQQVGRVDSERQTRIGDMLERPAKTGLMLTVMVTSVGGLAMAVFGLGLQSEKPRAAWAALVTTLLQALMLVLAGVGLWVGEASIISRLWHLLLTLLTWVLVGFCVAALKQVRDNPPPVHVNLLEE